MSETEVQLPPQKTNVLVIGGGPGGAYTACVLAREGIDVVVLEADKFPRYHVGESQLPSMRHFLRFIDLEETFEQFGFMKKVGAAFKFNQNKKEGYTDFVVKDQGNYSWNVTRAQSDELLLRHASSLGARVFESTRVTDVAFSSDSDSKPISASYKNKITNESGSIAFDYVVDASGRAGVLSTKYLKNRVFTEDLRNVAWWGYWTDCGCYAQGTRRAGAPYFEALTDESGWAWFIPLHDNTTSIGIVMNQDTAVSKRAKRSISTSEAYDDALNLVPFIQSLIGEKGKMIQKDGGPLVRSASDYSYSAQEYAGNGYRIVGDAGAFLDPFFSSGVHLALTGGLSAAATICAAIRGDCSEADAVGWHNARVQTSYTRFLLVVMSAYQQIHSQNEHILASEEEENFDVAFEHFRPIIQGTLEAGATANLTRDQLKRTIDFCSKYAFEPSEPEERAKVVLEAANGKAVNGTAENGSGNGHITNGKDANGKAKNAVNGNVKNATDLEAVRRAMLTRRLMGTDDNIYADGFAGDCLVGYRVRLEKGVLGLIKE